MLRHLTFRLAAIVAAASLALLIAACEDDPIIGPTGEGSEGTGSYGDIQHLPADSVAVDSMANRPFPSKNPVRF